MPPRHKGRKRHAEEDDEEVEEPDEGEDTEHEQQPATQPRPRQTHASPADVKKEAARPQSTGVGTPRGFSGAGSGPCRPSLSSNRQPVRWDPADLASMRSKTEVYKQEHASKAQQIQVNLNNQELEHLAGIAIRYMLFNHYEKPGVPVARDKLSKAITVEYEGHQHVRRIPQIVIPLAQYKMASVFGLDMREVERRTSAKKDEASANKLYVVRSLLPGNVREALPRQPNEQYVPNYGLTMLVLALIHLADGRIVEDDLWDKLDDLGLDRDDHAHPQLGKLSEQFQRMEACKYISKERRVPGSGEGMAYVWSECAHADVGEAGIKAWMESEMSKHQRRLLGAGLAPLSAAAP